MKDCSNIEHQRHCQIVCRYRKQFDQEGIVNHTEFENDVHVPQISLNFGTEADQVLSLEVYSTVQKIVDGNGLDVFVYVQELV